MTDPKLSNKLAKDQARITKVAGKLGTSSDASSASKIASSVTKAQQGPEQTILTILQQIESEACKGQYHIATTVPATILQKVADYFAKKNYLVAFTKTNKSPNILIAWLGSRSWYKSTVGGKNDDHARVSLGITRFTTLVSDNIGLKYQPIYYNPRISGQPDLRASDFMRVFNRIR